MATAKQGGRSSKGHWGTALLVIAAAGAGAWWYWGDDMRGQAQAATAFGAKTACSCRYVAGRELGSCEQDFVPGMEAVFLLDDEGDQAVTAYVPLVSSNSARYREGFGCMLDPWDQ